MTAAPVASFVEAMARLDLSVDVVANPGAVAGVIDALVAKAGGQPIGFDFETVGPAPLGGLDPLQSRPRLLSLYAPDDGRVVVADLFATGLSPWLPLFAAVPLVAFNAAFEVRTLIANGLTPGPVDCAMVAAGLERGDVAKSLDVEAARLFDVDLPPTAAKKAMQRRDWSGPLDDEALAYSALDAVLAQAIWSRCAGATDCAAYDLARAAIPVVARMELTGVGLDVAAHDAVAVGWGRLLDREVAAFVERYGFRPSQRQRLADQLEATAPAALVAAWPRSPKTGKLALGKRALDDPGRAALPLVADYVRANKLASLYGTFGPALRKRLHPLDGRLHGGFRIGGARTGRLSSSPNLQNLPKVGGFRRMIRATPGRVMVTADYSAVELRAAAIEAGDDGLFALFAHAPTDTDGNRDPDGCPHEAIARQLELSHPDGEEGRIRLAKACNFGLLFGAGPPGFASYAGVDVGEAADLIEGWRRVRSALHRWQQRHGAQAVARRVASTPGGRVVDLTARDPVTGLRFVSRNRALSVPIQGGCAELMLRALVRVDAALAASGLDAAMVLTVHDEIVVEALAGDADAVAVILADEMRAAFLDAYGDRPGGEACARHVVDRARIGEAWGGDPLDPDDLPPGLWRGLEATLDGPVEGDDDDDPAVDWIELARALTIDALASNPRDHVAAAYRSAGVNCLASAPVEAVERLCAILEAPLARPPKEAAHATLGPSSAERWLYCPGSVDACRSATRYDGVAPHKGKLAHALFEWRLRAGIEAADVGGIADEWPELVPLVDPMAAWVEAQPGERFLELRLAVDDALDCWGTADVVLVEPERLTIADLKAGKVAVDVDGNVQLGAYAIGARNRFGRRPRYRLAIMQPQASAIPAVVEVDDAWLDQLEARLKAAGSQALDDRAPRVAGDWCKWCAARFDCPAKGSA